MRALDATQLPALARAVPDALRPSWMHATWSGTHGSGGLTADLHAASSRLTLTDTQFHGSGGAEGTITGPGAGTPGSIRRSVGLGSSGELTVNHGLIRLPAAAQGSGFSRGLNERAFRGYAEAGVEQVGLSASLRVGPYAWARQGFEINAARGLTGADAERSRGEKLGQLLDTAVLRWAITKEQLATIEHRIVRPGRPMPANPLVSIGDLAAIPTIGKAALLDSRWEGTRQVARTVTWQERLGVRPGLAGVADAAQGMHELLPRAQRPSARRGIDDALRSAGLTGQPSSTKTTLRFEGADDALVEATTIHTFPLRAAGALELTLRLTDDGSLTARQSGGSVHAVDVLQPSLDDALRGLGIDRLTTAGSPATTRSLGNA